MWHFPNLWRAANCRSAMGDSGEGEVTDALKYLDELDKYYSQAARPRLAKRIQKLQKVNKGHIGHTIRVTQNLAW